MSKINLFYKAYSQPLLATTKTFVRQLHQLALKTVLPSLETGTRPQQHADYPIKTIVVSSSELHSIKIDKGATEHDRAIARAMTIRWPESRLVARAHPDFRQ